MACTARPPSHLSWVPAPVSGRVLRDNYLHCLHPHYPRSRGTQHWPSLCWAGRPCQAPPWLPGHTPAPGEGWGMPREGAGMAVSTAHQLGPQAQSRFLGLHAVLQDRPHPCPKSHLPVVWSPALVAHTTDKSSHAKWEFNCKQFLWIMGPSVPPYAKGEKKKFPVKKKKVFLPVPSPKQTPKETVARVFLAGGRHGAGTHRGGFLHCGHGKVRGWGGAGVS